MIFTTIPKRFAEKYFPGACESMWTRTPVRSHPLRRQPLPDTDLPQGWTENIYTTNYFIPNDNPFVDPQRQSTRGILGGRPAQSASHDARPGHGPFLDWRCRAGYVGGNRHPRARGELSVGYMEGFHPVKDKIKPSDLIGVERPPLYEYEHGTMGNCVIGGYVYRGTQFAKELGGKYIFGDNGSGRLWALTWNGTDAPTVNYLCNMPPGVN